VVDPSFFQQKLIKLAVIFGLVNFVAGYCNLLKVRLEQVEVILTANSIGHQDWEINRKVTDTWTTKERLYERGEVCVLSHQVGICISTKVALPSGDVDVATLAARAYDVLLNGNRQPKDSFYCLGWMYRFGNQPRKPFAELLEESGVNLAVRVVFMQVHPRTIRNDAVSTVGADEDHILRVDDIRRAFEKSVVDD
jgi:hypothetical protein